MPVAVRILAVSASTVIFEISAGLLDEEARTVSRLDGVGAAPSKCSVLEAAPKIDNPDEGTPLDMVDVADEIACVAVTGQTVV